MTRSQHDWISRLKASPVIAVLRHDDPKPLPEAAAALARGGIQFIELTLTVPNALLLLSELAETLPLGTELGAGSVTSMEEYDRAVDSGARFIVSPIVQPDIIDKASANGIPVIPGAFSPTEIHAAWEHGADLVKVFPARILGPDYIRDLLAPLPEMKLIPSGGIDARLALRYLEAGAAAVSLGSALVQPDQLQARDYQAIEAAARRVVGQVRSRPTPPARAQA